VSTQRNFLLKDIARANGRTVSEKQRETVRRVLAKTAEEAKLVADASGSGLSSLDLLSVAPLRARTLKLFVCWSCSIVSVYALVLNVEALSGDVFLNFVLGNLAEIPAHGSVYLFVGRLGMNHGENMCTN